MITVIIWIMLYDVEYQRRSTQSLRFPSQRKIVRFQTVGETAQHNPPLYTETVKSCYPKIWR